MAKTLDLGKVVPDIPDSLTGSRNCEYGGRDLSTVFASAEALRAAVAARDFSKIRVGDYWPITLNGTIYDYAAGENKTLSNAVMKMEVAGIDTYYQYGDTPVPHHLVMLSRDLLPWTLMYRSEASTWYDTAATNPWLGSHLYQTLNNTSNGVLARVKETALGPYIYAGPNGKGMRFLAETKAAGATSATGWGWVDRGLLFLPTEREVWGQDVWSEHSWGGGAGVQYPIFEGSLRHIIKGLGNGGGRYGWWCGSSYAGGSTNFCNVSNSGDPSNSSATTTWLGAPVGFLLA